VLDEPTPIPTAPTVTPARVTPHGGVTATRSVAVADTPPHQRLSLDHPQARKVKPKSGTHIGPARGHISPYESLPRPPNETRSSDLTPPPPGPSHLTHSTLPPPPFSSREAPNSYSALPPQTKLPLYFLALWKLPVSDEVRPTSTQTPSPSIFALPSTSRSASLSKSRERGTQILRSLSMHRLYHIPQTP